MNTAVHSTAVSHEVHSIRHALIAAWALLAGIAMLMLGTGLQGSLLGVRASRRASEP